MYKSRTTESRMFACTGAQHVQPDDEAKWWYRTFARSGRLGSSAPRPSLAPPTKPKVTKADMSLAPLTSALPSRSSSLYIVKDPVHSKLFHAPAAPWPELLIVMIIC